MSKKIPVFILAGWLGAGKTTFLNQLLAQTAGLKIGALINDFGEINVDVGLVDQQVDEVVSLSNGCLCCSLSNELDDSLNKLTAANPKLNAIVIEASGVADAAQMVSLIFNSQNPHIEFRDLVYLVDAVNFHSLWLDKPHLIQAGAKVGTLILINKIDLATPDEIVFAETKIREINPAAIVLKTKQAQIDAKLLIDTPAEKNTQLRLGHTKYHHSHSHDNKVDFQQLTFQTDKPLDPLITTDLLNHLPKGLYRAKGWLNFGAKCPGHKIIFQKIGRFHQLKAKPWSKTEQFDTRLVFIGPKFNKKQLLDRLNSCIDQNPDDVTPENTVSYQLFL